MGKDGVFGQHETAEYKFLLMRVSFGDVCSSHCFSSVLHSIVVN